MSTFDPVYTFNLDQSNPFRKYFELIEVYENSILIDFIRYYYATGKFMRSENSKLEDARFEDLVDLIREQFGFWS